jgi:hypothetical protein
MDGRPTKEERMDVLAIHRRVERTIRECRALGIKPDSRTVAEIMIDDDATAGKYEEGSSDLEAAFREYERAAAHALSRLTLVASAPKRQSA